MKLMRSQALELFLSFLATKRDDISETAAGSLELLGLILSFFSFYPTDQFFAPFGTAQASQD